jgi:hypothetical protein
MNNEKKAMTSLKGLSLFIAHQKKKRRHQALLTRCHLLWVHKNKQKQDKQ